MTKEKPVDVGTSTTTVVVTMESADESENSETQIFTRETLLEVIQLLLVRPDILMAIWEYLTTGWDLLIQFLCSIP